MKKVTWESWLSIPHQAAACYLSTATEPGSRDWCSITDCFFPRCFRFSQMSAYVCLYAVCSWVVYTVSHQDRAPPITAHEWPHTIVLPSLLLSLWSLFPWHLWSGPPALQFCRLEIVVEFDSMYVCNLLKVGIVTLQPCPKIRQLHVWSIACLYIAT